MIWIKHFLAYLLVFSNINFSNEIVSTNPLDNILKELSDMNQNIEQMKESMTDTLNVIFSELNGISKKLDAKYPSKMMRTRGLKPKSVVYSSDNTETEDDDMTRKQAGETVNQRMARQCQIAMNPINKNLQFTVECEDDYEDKKLPTLDFKIWQEKDGKINHTYYQKEMKSPYLIMARSAAPQAQKIQILSNELTRRLLNINRQENEQE